MELQELITRARYIMGQAPSRIEVFELVNGKRTAADIARSTKRHRNNIRRDLTILCDAGLVQPCTDSSGAVKKKDGFTLYDKIPLARTLSSKYFRPSARRPDEAAAPEQARRARRKGNAPKSKAIPLPNESEFLDICKGGEDQTHEFKGQGTEIRKIVREIAAMLNTISGGLVLYGVDDEGTIQGSGVSRQKFDQPLQNSVKDNISPAATVSLHSVSALGSNVLVIVVPPWNREDVYQFDGRVLLRKGTNVFAAKPEEVRRLHNGDPVI
jgi:hypothetical protein